MPQRAGQCACDPSLVSWECCHLPHARCGASVLASVAIYMGEIVDLAQSRWFKLDSKAGVFQVALFFLRELHPASEMAKTTKTRKHGNEDLETITDRGDLKFGRAGIRRFCAVRLRKKEKETKATLMCEKTPAQRKNTPHPAQRKNTPHPRQ